MDHFGYASTRSTTDYGGFSRDRGQNVSHGLLRSRAHALQARLPSPTTKCNTRTAKGPTKGQCRATGSGKRPPDLGDCVSSSKVPHAGDGDDDIATKFLLDTCSKFATQHRDPVLNVGRFSNKVTARVSFTKADALEVLSVLDTEAVPNFIHQDAVSGLRITPQAPGYKSMELEDARGHALKVCETTVLTVRIADHVTRVPFLVAERLSTEMILGCDYIYKHVDAMHPKKGVLYMSNY